jgi:hypothetical protein
MNDVHINGLITAQQRAHRECGQIFQLQQISEIAGGEFCNVCAEFIRSDRAIAFAVANDEQLTLDAGERSPAQQRSDGCCISMIELLAVRRQQRKTAGGIDALHPRRPVRPRHSLTAPCQMNECVIQDVGRI